jgi:hypothetical protein
MPQDTLWLLPHLVRQAHGVLARMLVYAQQLQALPRRVRRWLRRKLALSLTELALLLALGPGLGWAATIFVDGTTCTLVDAITAANTDATVAGSQCPAGSGADTLVLVPGSTHTLTSVNNTTFGATGLPVVTSTITIQGNGSTVQRGSGAPNFRLLAVGTTGNLTVQQLTLQGGQTSGDGGGVFNQGTLTLSQCTLSGNSAGISSPKCDIGAFELIAALPPVVDSLVSFVAQPATCRTSPTVPTACPANTVGTFSFQALLTVTGSMSLEALKAQVTTLTQSNTLLLADGGAATSLSSPGDILRAWHTHRLFNPGLGGGSAPPASCMRAARRFCHA